MAESRHIFISQSPSQLTMGGGAATDGGFAVPVTGATGWRGLLENKKALGLATFASLGGVLYGYNQGGRTKCSKQKPKAETETLAVFAQVQVASDFARRFPAVDDTNPEFYDKNVKSFLTSILELTAFVRVSAVTRPHAYSRLSDRSSGNWSSRRPIQPKVHDLWMVCHLYRRHRPADRRNDFTGSGLGRPSRRWFGGRCVVRPCAHGQCFGGLRDRD